MKPRISAGDLDQRVTPLKPTTAEDAAGQVAETFAAQPEVWARVRPLRGRDLLAAAAAQSTAEMEITIRYQPGVNGHWRWRWNGIDYSAVGEPVDVDGGHHTLEIMTAAAGPATA